MDDRLLSQVIMLGNGERRPTTAAEKTFVKVCAGKQKAGSQVLREWYWYWRLANMVESATDREKPLRIAALISDLDRIATRFRDTKNNRRHIAHALNSLRELYRDQPTLFLPELVDFINALKATIKGKKQQFAKQRRSRRDKAEEKRKKKPMSYYGMSNSITYVVFGGGHPGSGKRR